MRQQIIRIKTKKSILSKAYSLSNIATFDPAHPNLNSISQLRTYLFLFTSRFPKQSV